MRCAAVADAELNCEGFLTKASRSLNQKEDPSQLPSHDRAAAAAATAFITRRFIDPTADGGGLFLLVQC